MPEVAPGPGDPVWIELLSGYVWKDAGKELVSPRSVVRSTVAFAVTSSGEAKI